MHWKEFEKFVLHIGCSFKRQKGDHRIYWRQGLRRPVVIPQDKNLPDFIIRTNLRTLGIDYERFNKILKEI
ncbi:MAG: type II toxin-antitoxin system HicA family toxin [Elusimicrobiota bacterium]